MSAPLEASSKTSPSASPTPAGRRSVPRRAVWFAVALLVFLVSSAVALTRPPRRDAFRRAEPFTREWWLSPIEWNATARLTTFTGRAYAVSAVPDEETVWIAGAEGLLVRTRDGGRSWEPVSLPEEALETPPRGVDRGGNPLPGSPPLATPHLYDIAFVDGRNGWIAGSNGRVLRTDDGGETWSVGPLLTAGRIVDVEFADAALGWALDGSYQLYRTRDGGAGWEKAGEPPPGLDGLVALAPGGVGWGVGRDGLLWITEDAGESFEPVGGPDDIESGGVGAEGTRASRPEGPGDRGGLEVGFASGPVSVQRAPVQQSPVQTVPEEATKGGAGLYLEPVPALRISAVHALTPDSAWVVVGEGDAGSGVVSRLYGTVDRGRTWRPLLEHPGDLGLVHSAGSLGIAVGRDSLTWATSDGGETWFAGMQVAAGPAAWGGAAIDGSGRLWVVGGGRTVEASDDGGRTWYAPAATGALNDLTFRGTAGWAVGDGGLVLATVDGGRTWHSRVGATRADLTAVAFADDRTGWAVGAGGTVVASTDGGRTWRAESIPTRDRLVDVAVARGGRPWAVSEDSQLFLRDGEGRWTRAPGPSFIGDLPRLGGSALFVDTDSTLRAAAEGYLVQGTDSGSWEALMSRTPDLALWDLYLPSAGTGWALAENAADGSLGVVRTDDGGRTWSPVPDAWPGADPGAGPSAPRASGGAIHFVDPARGWIAGSDGVVRRTGDGGGRWLASSDTVEVGIRALHFTDENRGWAVGEGVSVLSTADGGDTWRDPRAPRRAAPPWYFLSWLVVAGLLVPAFRRPESQPAPEESVADSLASDRPITSKDPDTLGLGRLARGISRFVRNVETQPPLTIAVTGPWGSGKSSLLNLVCDDLRDRGFRPVWFNAWHHQKEEHLLASLLANIRAQAVPSWITPGGIAFRARLLGLRAWRDRWLILALLFVFAASAGYFRQHGESIADAPADLLDHVVQLLPDFGRPTDAGSGEAPGTHGQLSGPTLVTLVGSFGWLLLGTLRGLAAFRVTPASLAAGLSQRAGIRDFDAQLGFRYRFAREFRDVTGALHPRTMVIVIDDLDRCRPENVLEVLEAVNFLVSCGDCFVLMGMDVDRVVRCVGMGFKDVAEELADDAGLPGDRLGAEHERAAEHEEGPVDPEERGRRRRTRFAYQYLEKLVNIEVPIPQPDPGQSERLLLSEGPAGGEGRVRWRQGLAAAAAVLAMPAVLGLGFWMGWASPGDPGDDLPDRSAPVRSAMVLEPGGRGSAGEDLTGPVRPDRDAGPDRSGSASPFVVIPGSSARGPRWSVFVPLLGLTVLGLALGMRTVPVVERDSPVFKSALAAVHPLVVRRRNNPRTIKRFLNRVRYYAMVQGGDGDAKGPVLADRIAVWVLGAWRSLRTGSPGRAPRRAGAGEVAQAPAEPSQDVVPRAPERDVPRTGRDEEEIPEDVLVLLASVQHLKPEWLEDLDFRSDAIGFVLSRVDLEEADAEELRGYAGWAVLREEHFSAFERLSRNVRVL